MADQPSGPPPTGAGRPHRHSARPPLRERLSLAAAARLRAARSRSVAWRLAAPVVFVVAGALFVTSAVSAGGTDLRAGRYGDLAGLVEAEADRVEELREEQARIAAEIDQLTASLGESGVGALQEQADASAGPAGLEAVRGPGVTVTLTDAPDAVIETIDENTNVNDLVVHQQDIQAVANALWAGGAEAMTIQGQRVVATTGIRCVGNTVILHGVPYAPPYVISAIGPTASMLRSLEDSPYIGYYLQAVDTYRLGWDVQIEQTIEAPAYAGPTEMSYARPVEPVAALAGDG